ncbi:uncharacterized protein CBL_13589 [Carabus blaptoides fortunei]
MADDFLSKKKDTGPILDLSKAAVNSKEDFRKLFDKVPDYKIRPVKVRQEEIKIREKHKDFKFKTGKKDLKVLKETYNFQEPVPPEMLSIKLEDLYPVPIDWRMLTTLRPKSKVDEDYFSRLVELGKSQLKTAIRDKRLALAESSIRKTKNKSGVIETRAICCIECGEEFCEGKTCGLFQYESFSRVSVEQKNKKIEPTQSTEQKSKKKLKRRSRSKTKSKRRNKSKSPLKSASRKSDKK